MLPLNAFLLRRNVTPANVWTDPADVEMFYWERERAAPLSLDEAELLEAALAGDVVIALLRRHSAPPKWQQFIRDALSLASFGSVHESLGAVIFCAVSVGDEEEKLIRWMAWTFGRASRALRRSAQDPRFGLLAVLNLLVIPLLKSEDSTEPLPSSRRRSPQLREMRYRTTAPYVQQTGHRAARDIPVDGFRVERSSDLVAAVGGTGADPALTSSTLLGGRSLRFRAGISRIEDLVELADVAVDRSRATDYKEAFSWIDNIRLVDDPDLISELRSQLVSDLLASTDPPSIDAILPDDLIDVGEDRSIRYIVFPRERGTGQGRVTLGTNTISSFLRQFPDDGDRIRELDSELRFLDESESPIGTASILECLSANLRRSTENFIAYDGDFYHVDQSFVARIDGALNKIPSSAITYPPYRGETEPDYNTKVGREHSDEFVELDRALIEIPGEYGVEASDLVAASGALIHVKRKGKSSVLSHLFLQAANSCELLRRSPQAWEQLASLISRRARNNDIIIQIAQAHLAAEQRREEIEVVFAFLGDWKAKTVTSLPLFSRISLASEARRLSILGFRPTVALISSR
jgi:uncharacterized protein (TIGR04141 family)